MIKNNLFNIEDNQSFFVSFTDIVTLLLILFIYLSTISNFNSSELDTVSQHISSKFKLEPILKETTLTDDNNDITPWHAMSDSLKKNILPNEAIRLSLDQSLLFQPGSATLIAEGSVYLKQLADVIQDGPYHIIIEGHADNKPIQNRQFQSNWHLSAMRAAEVTNALESFGIPGKNLSCRGFGDMRPINEDASTLNDLGKII